jgi:CRP/FNR family transcriptional regulator
MRIEYTWSHVLFRCGERGQGSGGSNTLSGLSARPSDEFGDAQPKWGWGCWCSSGHGRFPFFLRLYKALAVTRLNDRVSLHENLVLGRRKLSEWFHRSPPRNLTAGELLVAAAPSSEVIFQLQAGWACQFRDFSDGSRAIVDIYLLGDVIGMDAVLRTRPLEEAMALTSITLATIDGEDALTDLTACRHMALYIAWLLGQRQRRADRLLAAISCLDARGRLATMLFDFYTRLRGRRLITGLIYNLPLTQIQIGSYLGLTVAHVNRMLRSLRDERIVNLEKHSVMILDLERLTRLAQNGRLVSPIASVASAP